MPHDSRLPSRQQRLRLASPCRNFGKCQTPEGLLPGSAVFFRNAHYRTIEVRIRLVLRDKELDNLTCLDVLRIRRKLETALRTTPGSYEAAPHQHWYYLARF